MKLRRIIFSFFAFTASFTGYLAAEDIDGQNRFDQEIDEADFRAVRDFVLSKQVMSLQEKSSNIFLSGDVRTSWRFIRQKLRGEDLRGGDTGIYVFIEDELINDEIYTTGERLPSGHNQFTIEFNLRLDYVGDCSWAVTHLAFDQSAGVDDNGLDPSIDPEGYHGSGSCDNLCLRQAYMGYNLYSCDFFRFDVELGRRGNLYYVFDSEVQFLSRLDGVLFTVQGCADWLSEWYVKAAGFIVDERVNQFAWAAEVGLLNIFDSGLDFKYSFIDWVKEGVNRCFVRNPIGFQFRTSQFTAICHLMPDVVNVPTKVYIAYLWNHSPARYTYVDGVKTEIGRQNEGGYFGFKVGEVYEEGDWSFEALYAIIQAQCIPDNDVRRIGTGNVTHDSFTADGFGNVNWKGWQIFGMYALTDNLAITALLEHSKTWKKNIAGLNHYNNFKLEAVYAF